MSTGHDIRASLQTALLDAGRYFGRIAGFQHNARAYLVGTFLMGLGHGAVWVHLNLYYRAIGLGEETIGRLLASSSLGTVLMAIPAALLVDRVPAQFVFAGAAIGYAVAIGSQLFAPNAWVLSALAVLAGMSFTVHWAAAAPFFMRNSTSQERIYLFGFSHAIETTATILAAVGVGWISRMAAARVGSELLGLRWALVVVAAVSFAALFAFLRIDSPPPAERSRRLLSYLKPKDWRLIVRLIVPSALVGLGAGLIIPFLNLYFRDRFGQNPFEIGGFFAVSQFFTVLGFLSGPAVAKRFGIVATVCLTQLLSIPFFLTLAFTQSLHLAVLSFWMRGSLMNMNHPLMTNFAMEIVGPDQQSVTNSLRMLAWNLSWMVSTQVGGYVIERHGFSPPMLMTIGLYFVATILTWVFWRDRTQVGKPASAA
ncbi:MAG: MFS transporter [Candidatus Eisenbacteria bacterium]